MKSGFEASLEKCKIWQKGTPTPTWQQAARAEQWTPLWKSCVLSSLSSLPCTFAWPAWSLCAFKILSTLDCGKD